MQAVNDVEIGGKGKGRVGGRERGRQRKRGRVGEREERRERCGNNRIQNKRFH